jgi:hypothetical protein
LEVLALNVCGLVSKLRNPDFREFISLYGIICLTETKLDNYDEVELDGYKLLPPVNLLNKSSGELITALVPFCKEQIIFPSRVEADLTSSHLRTI